MEESLQNDSVDMFPNNPYLKPRALIQKFCYGKTSIPDWEPIKKTKNATIRFGTIVSSFLQDALEFEGEQFILTRATWQHVLQFGKLDFILVESTLEDCTNDWNLAQTSSSDNYAELLNVIAEAKRFKIPTVYWQTAGKEYHDMYSAFSKNFDFIFCAEKEEVELYALEKVTAQYLAPCVQPALANPFRHIGHYDALDWGIIYDGWKDLERKPELWNILQHTTNMDLHIIESNAILFKSSIFAKSKVCPEYARYLHGCVTTEQRRTLLKYAKIHITLSEGLSSACRQRWLMLESAACGVLPLYHGSFVDGDVCRGVARECDKADWLLLELERCRQDPWYLKRLSHLAWRKVNNEHTFSHRIRSICNAIGVKHDWIEYPLISMVTPTYRKENLDSVINICASQTYPNKEHIIITNGFSIPKASQNIQNNCPLTYISVPEENFAGTCLNIGFQQSKGEYVYRIDDDDPYGENYILDTILNNRALDLDWWGKVFQYIYKDDGNIYSRIVNKRKHSLFKFEGTQWESAWPAGHSYGGKRSFLKNKFENSLLGAADSAFLESIKGRNSYIAVFDDFNIAAYRSNNLDMHTWKCLISVAEEKLSFDEIMV